MNLIYLVIKHLLIVFEFINQLTVKLLKTNELIKLIFKKIIAKYLSINCLGRVLLKGGVTIKIEGEVKSIVFDETNRLMVKSMSYEY
jgi:hypothetical protein